jgi:hypothetical protein
MPRSFSVEYTEMKSNRNLACVKFGGEAQNSVIFDGFADRVSAACRKVFHLQYTEMPLGRSSELEAG